MPERAEGGEVEGTVYTPYRVDVPPSDDPVIEMKRAVVALAWEIPDEVWRDVRDRWNAVAKEVERLRAGYRRRTEELIAAQGEIDRLRGRRGNHGVTRQDD